MTEEPSATKNVEWKKQPKLFAQATTKTVGSPEVADDDRQGMMMHDKITVESTAQPSDEVRELSSSSPTNADDKPSDNHNSDEHYDSDDEYQGPSDCGYSDAVHNSFMAVGKSIHAIVGDPPQAVENPMTQAGDWFQEASVVVRDFVTGKADIKEEASDMMSSIVKMTSGEEDDDDEEGAAAAAGEGTSEEQRPEEGTASGEGQKVESSVGEGQKVESSAGEGQK